MKAFAAEDLKLGVFLPPLFALHTGQVLRQWEEFVNDSGNLIGKHPKDFRLVLVGEFEDSTGEIIPCEKQIVATPGEYLKAKPPGGDPRQMSMV